MNNEGFRNLLLANAAKSSKDGASPASKASGGAGPAALGSRLKSSIPMTPRSVAGAGRNTNDFARQLAERNAQAGDGPRKKKFRTAAPKGSKFAEGYTDRAKARLAQEEEDDRAARIEALEESLKTEEIDQATFERLRSEIAGGDLSSTHLIKGLDFNLLERVRKGEDVFGAKSEEGKEEPEQEHEEEEEEGPAEEDVDDAFEELEEKEVAAITKEKAKKKGQFATTTLVPGQKRTRDQILAEMKAAREAAKAKQESALGSRFKKIGAKKEPGTRIERDGKGREVLIIVDEDGHEKRKVRKVAAEELEKEREAFVPDPTADVLGMEVPEAYQKKAQEQQEEEDLKMFSDVESDYDPLAGIASDSDDSDDDEDKEKKVRSPKATDHPSPTSEEGEVVESDSARSKAMPPPPRPQAPPQPQPQAGRNYFKSPLISEESRSGPALNDPAVMAALKKAKTLSAAAKSEEQELEEARQARLKQMIANRDRDDEDMDMGFGTNRGEDEQDGDDDGRKVKLSAWGGDDEDGDDMEGGGKSKRKRGAKKRKGDANNVADVMRVLDKRKEAK